MAVTIRAPSSTARASHGRGSSMTLGKKATVSGWTQNGALRVGGIATTVSYAMIMLAGGHGVGPIGLLLFLGAAPEWLPGMLLGWLAIVLEVIAFCRVGKKMWKRYATLAIGGFVLSAVAFVLASDTLHHFGAGLGSFMIPFVVSSIVRVAQIISRRNA